MCFILSLLSYLSFSLVFFELIIYLSVAYLLAFNFLLLFRPFQFYVLFSR
jgi:hypothetical protein